MAVARIQFRGDLEDFLLPARRGKELTQAFFGTTSVKDVIESAGVPHPEVEYVLVDGQSVPLTHRVSRDVRLEVFPRSTPPEPLPEVRAGVTPPDPPRFILDVHLGKLAASLRMLGFDAAWSNDADDKALAKLASSEERILLTRDVGLLKRAEVKHGYWPRSSGPWQQLHEVVTRYGLQSRVRSFTRCMKCNGVLRPVRKAEVEALLPPRVKAEQAEFHQCQSCRQVYWKGTHHAKMQGRIAQLPRGPVNR